MLKKMLICSGKTGLQALKIWITLNIKPSIGATDLYSVSIAGFVAVIVLLLLLVFLLFVVAISG